MSAPEEKSHAQGGTRTPTEVTGFPGFPRAADSVDARQLHETTPSDASRRQSPGIGSSELRLLGLLVDVGGQLSADPFQPLCAEMKMDWKFCRTVLAELCRKGLVVERRVAITGGGCHRGMRVFVATVLGHEVVAREDARWREKHGICACGRGGMMAGHRICVFCFDDEEAEHDALAEVPALNEDPTP